MGQVNSSDSHDYIAITILDIFHSPVYYLQQNVSETKFCLRLQVELSVGVQEIELVSVSEDRTMDNVQNCDSYINVSLSQRLCSVASSTIKWPVNLRNNRNTCNFLPVLI
jgi:hypothetical protein